MTEIIKLQKSNGGKDVVSARELYQFLGYDISNWNRWYQKNIVKNQFAFENQDWAGFVIETNGNQTRDFMITLDFAKRLSMMAKTAKGEEVRNYFIECEKIAKQSLKPVQALPTDFISALEQLLTSKKNELILEERLKEVQPKVEMFDMAMSSRDTLDMSKVAKILCVKGFGRNNLFEKLREKKVLRENNEPYQDFVSKGWFKIVETPYTNKDGKSGISTKTVVFQKGLEGIRQILTT